MFEFGCPVSLRLLKTYDTRMTSTSQDDYADVAEANLSGGDEPVLTDEGSVSCVIYAYIYIHDIYAYDFLSPDSLHPHHHICIVRDETASR